MEVERLDHFVLTVKNIEAAADFYVSVMGMKKSVFGEGRVALSFGRQKINLHEHGREFEPKAGSVCPGSADLCFIIKGSLEEAAKHIAARGVTIIEGPVRRTGAVGPITSLYFRDPDRNLIEVSVYGAE
jgi:catechol 2,3-dioxygenase-like lactoylglutathione lyase family enzyme